MEKRSISSTPELWGGVECSFNRVGDNFMDQLQMAGHYQRVAEDIQKFADLGIKAIRYPVIWERHQPEIHTPIDFSFAEQALKALREYKIEPIVGLVHHGSGPSYADFSTSGFADGLSRFAARVAEKFPWVNYYTPVNEPLTTARFAGLYGLWYPHHRNDRAFVNIFLNEMKAIVLSMREIRKINPGAKLVQTEDLAKIYSTPLLKYQADFENERRWLTNDILCGKLQPGHALWNYFKRYARSEKELYFFVENPCAPDIIGWDYYATSERYLDEDVAKYPSHTHGRNAKHQYADVEAVRVRISEATGISVLVREAWERYQIPMALTEVHINCDPDNQIRWFGQIRNQCRLLLQSGVKIVATTTWAMLGSFGWNKLLTQPYGDYEAGAFDVSTGQAIRTEIGNYIHAIARDPEFAHRALDSPGWWEEESRLIFETAPLEELEAASLPEGRSECL